MENKKVLNKTIKEKIEHFESFIVMHPFLKKAFKQACDVIIGAGEETLVFVCGPSGVGKKALIKLIFDHFNEMALSDPDNNKGRIPVVKVEAVASDVGNYDWNDFFTRALIATEEPLIDYKVNCEGKKDLSNLAKSARRRALENALYYRSPYVFIIDEAQHIAKVSSGRKFQDQFDVIKSIANITGIPHMLVGTYELLPLAELNGQLNRRTIDIHFPRYSSKNSDELEAFIRVLLTLQNELPLEETPNLVEHWEYFYKFTLGCCGILKRWLLWTLKVALNNGASSVTIDDFDKYKIPVSKCRQLLDEAIEGEQRIMEMNMDEGYEKLLGLEKIVSRSDDREKTGDSDCKKKKKHKVGNRKPTRDPVGGFKNAK